ncbi:MAG: GNAT family N-acetyltransferase [Bacteroidota bacterium]
MNRIIEKATLSDSAELSELTYKSKAHWGYSEEQMEKWRDDLQVLAEYIENNEVFITRESDQIAGYYSFSKVSDSTIKLDNIFIDPEHIGKGFGLTLMRGFLNRVKKLEIATITLDSEPNAEQFYQRFGFKIVGQLKSSIPYRFLPIMELNLNH